MHVARRNTRQSTTDNNVSYREGGSRSNTLVVCGGKHHEDQKKSATESAMSDLSLFVNRQAKMPQASATRLT